jgi:hypothetical protein
MNAAGHQVVHDVVLSGDRVENVGNTLGFFLHGYFAKAEVGSFFGVLF